MKRCTSPREADASGRAGQMARTSRSVAVSSGICGKSGAWSHVVAQAAAGGGVFSVVISGAGVSPPHGIHPCFPCAEILHHAPPGPPFLMRLYVSPVFNSKTG